MGIQRATRKIAARAGIVMDRWPARGTLDEIYKLILDTYAPDQAVDVGANVGQWGLHIRQCGYTGPLLSIEPVDSAYTQLTTAAVADRAWHTMQAAVGDHPGDVQINVAESTSVSSLMTVRQATLDGFTDVERVRKNTRAVHRQAVKMVTLDQLEIPGQRVLLKTDTQGYDLQVLDGAEDLLNRTVALQCELSVIPLYEGMRNDWRAMVDRIEASGFALSGMFHIARDASLREVEMDGVFVKPSALNVVGSPK